MSSPRAAGSPFSPVRFGWTWAWSSCSRKNQVKTEFTAVLTNLVKSAQLGYYFSDRGSLVNVPVDLSTEPDGVFVSWDAIQSGRCRFVEGAQEGHVELEGTPDMVLEVVGPSSVRKDTVVLRDLYHKAGIPEYWLVDARRSDLRFDILHLDEAHEYTPVAPADGWVRSAVFGRWFQFSQSTDRPGHPQYTLNSREAV